MKSSAIASTTASGLSAIDTERCKALGLTDNEMAAVSQLPELYESTTTSAIIGYVKDGMTVSRVAECLRLQDGISLLNSSSVRMIDYAVGTLNFTSTDEVNDLAADAGKFMVGGRQLDAAEYEQYLMASIVAGDKPGVAAESMFHSPGDDVISTLVEAVSRLECVQGIDPLEYLMMKLNENFDGDIVTAYRLCVDSEARFLALLAGEDAAYAKDGGDDFEPDILITLGAMGLSPRDLGLGEETPGGEDEESEEVEEDVEPNED